LFISNHGVGRPFTFKILVVTSRQIGFELTIALKCELSKVSKIVYTSGNHG